MMKSRWLICTATVVALCSGILMSCTRKARLSPPGPTPSTSGTSGVTENAITMNALLSNSLSVNATASLLMVQSPLNSATYNDPSSYLYMQLLDEYAQEFMEYLVSCALKPGDSVTWTPPAPGVAPMTWPGQLGLCPQWHNGGVADDTDCQELISACLLARNNAFGQEVQISVRGFDTQGQYFGNWSPVPGTSQAEYELFDEREGAFYGNLFNTEYLDPGLRVEVQRESPSDFALIYDYALAAGRRDERIRRWRADYRQYGSVEALRARTQAHEDFMRRNAVTSAVVYRDMYACWAPEWTQGQAYLHARICAGPTNDERCAAQAVGACGENTVPEARTAPQHLCGDEHVPNVGFWDFDDCVGTAAASKPNWPFPITVFLKNSCDIVDRDDVCRRRNASAAFRASRPGQPGNPNEGDLQ